MVGALLRGRKCAFFVRKHLVVIRICGCRDAYVLRIIIYGKSRQQWVVRKHVPSTGLILGIQCIHPFLNEEPCAVVEYS